MSLDSVCPVCGCNEPRPIEDALRARIAELEAENAQLREAQRWIPIEERLPEDDEVLAWGDERTDTVFTDGEAWYCYTGIGKVFTHWMPLPPPPHHQE